MEKATISAKLYASGKIIASAEGNPDFSEQAWDALKSPGVCDVDAVVYEDQFVKAMRDRGIPDEAIKEYLENLSIMNEAYVKENSIW